MSSVNHERAASIVRDAGGEIVGRTRLQKIGYLLKAVGWDHGFDYEYRHYGPYSEDLARSIELADFIDFVREEERPTSWGGFYSVYTYNEGAGDRFDKNRSDFVRCAAKESAIALELAATALFVHREEHVDEPWNEVVSRKPEKATRENI